MPLLFLNACIVPCMGKRNPFIVCCWSWYGTSPFAKHAGELQLCGQESIVMTRERNLMTYPYPDLIEDNIHMQECHCRLPWTQIFAKRSLSMSLAIGAPHECQTVCLFWKMKYILYAECISAHHICMPRTLAIQVYQYSIDASRLDSSNVTLSWVSSAVPEIFLRLTHTSLSHKDVLI